MSYDDNDLTALFEENHVSLNLFSVIYQSYACVLKSTENM